MKGDRIWGPRSVLVVIVAAIAMTSIGGVAGQLNPFGSNLFNIAQQHHQSITNQVHAQLNQAFAAVGLDAALNNGPQAPPALQNPVGNPFYNPTFGPPQNTGRPPFPGRGMPMPPPPPPPPAHNGDPGQMYPCNPQMGFNQYGANCQPGYHNNNNNIVRPPQPQGFQSRPNHFPNWYPQGHHNHNHNRHPPHGFHGNSNQIPQSMIPHVPTPATTQPTNAFPNWYPPNLPAGFPNSNMANGFPDASPWPTPQTNPWLTQPTNPSPTQPTNPWLTPHTNPAPTPQTNHPQTGPVFQPVPTPGTGPSPATKPTALEDNRAKPKRIHLVFPDSPLYVHRYQRPVEPDPTKQIDIRR